MNAHHFTYVFIWSCVHDNAAGDMRDTSGGTQVQPQRHSIGWSTWPATVLDIPFGIPPLQPTKAEGNVAVAGRCTCGCIIGDGSLRGRIKQIITGDGTCSPPGNSRKRD